MPRTIGLVLYRLYHYHHYGYCYYDYYSSSGVAGVVPLHQLHKKAPFWTSALNSATLCAGVHLTHTHTHMHAHTHVQAHTHTHTHTCTPPPHTHPHNFGFVFPYLQNVHRLKYQDLWRRDPWLHRVPDWATAAPSSPWKNGEGSFNHLPPSAPKTWKPQPRNKSSQKQKSQHWAYLHYDQGYLHNDQGYLHYDHSYLHYAQSYSHNNQNWSHIHTQQGSHCWISTCDLDHT